VAGCKTFRALRKGLSGLDFDRLGDHFARGSDRSDVMRLCYRRGGNFGLRFRLCFYSRRALAELAGRHGIDTVGGRGVLRLVLHFNLRSCLRRGHRLLRNRQNCFGSFVNRTNLSLCGAGLVDLLDALLCGRDLLLRDGGCSN